jgi:hypothetical protein
LILRALTLAIIATGGAAEAQSYYCARPGEPYMPSAYSADYDRMQRVQREVNDYIRQMNTYLDCLANEHEDARGEARRVVDDWESTVRRFNNQ